MTPKTTILLFLISALFISCLNDASFECRSDVEFNVDPTQLAKDIDAIDAYLADSSITAVKDPTGLRYVVNQKGTGIEPTICNVVTVDYKAILLKNGKLVDESTNPVSFNLAGLITGWQIGLPKIKTGGAITLYIPSVYAYGDSNLPGIPQNSNLIFTINLLITN